MSIEHSRVPCVAPSRARRECLALAAAVSLFASSFAMAASEPSTGATILRDLRSFRTTATVLHVGAHPDDENTQLIAYFARGRGYRTAYLSLTRGDGGQNELGPDFGEKLGVLRTQELLAARRIDGGRQFFTRAVDFGFSKTPEETLRFWDSGKVLGDVVRVIREFRPDVIITRFPIPPGSGGHGHHTASAILTVEAFKLAGDPTAFPEQLAQGLSPWHAKRVVWNSWSGQRSGGLAGPTVELDIGGSDPVTGESFGTIANRSRGMHKTQGLGGFSNRVAEGPNVQKFMHLAGDPATHDLMEGVDDTWNRIPGGADIARLADTVIAGFDPNQPAASVPALLNIRAKLATLPTDPLVADKRAQLDRILQACLALRVSTTIAHAGVVPGESFVLHHTAVVGSRFPVRWLAVRENHANKPVELRIAADLSPSVPATRDSTHQLSIEAPLTQPYWLREDATEGLFTVSDPTLIGRPESPPAFPLEQVFEVGGQTLAIADEPVEVVTDPARGETRRPLDVIGPVSVEWEHDLTLLRPGETKDVTLDLNPARSGVAGTLSVEISPGWKISPTQREFHLGAVGERARFTFAVTAPAQPARAAIAVRAAVGPRRYHRRYTELRYDHLPVQVLQPSSVLTAVALDVAVRAKKVGYVRGPGDDVPDCLRLLGCDVTELAATDFTADKLRGFDAVVLGVRAFNERADLAANLPALLAYVEGGGTVVAQYNRPNGLKDKPLGPYPLSIEGPAPQLRVTDENAPITLLAPDHPALLTPNQIAPGDFTGWIQERGAYFPSSWDEAHYQALFGMSDAGEAPLKGSLLVARYGRGYYVYTGLSFFRQLPAGVPGAYRLFANLISLGK